MSNKKEIIQELEMLNANKLSGIIDSKETHVDSTYLSKSKEEILSIINIPSVKYKEPSEAYLDTSKSRILQKISQPESKVVSIKKWWKPISYAASLAILLAIGINLTDSPESEGIDISGIETNEIIDYLDEALLDIDTEVLYTALESELDLEIELSDETTIDLIYDEISLEAIEEYY